MRLKTIHCYVALVCTLAGFSLLLVQWEELGALPSHDKLGLTILVAFGLFSEWLTVRTNFLPSGSGHTITFIPLLAAVLLFGPVAPVILMGITGGVAEILFRKKEAIRATFNVSQYILAACLAGWAFVELGGTGSASLSGFALQLLPFFGFLIVFIFINHTAVFLAIAFSQTFPFSEVWRKLTASWGLNGFYDVMVSPLAIVVAFFYASAGWLGLVLSLLPLFFIRHAYLNTYRLELANRDLLKVLVKAIETRDPYTSGHSQRVAALAGQIARQMNLSARKIETVEMSALLHDVGKIDVIYTEILRKPERLTEEEQRIIQSHVTKGVELLKSLTSVPEDVIAAVRHHHERENGSGYPDGLTGLQIPLGAKIIKVCDAIDAMLSDRPYRAALTRDQVRKELANHVNEEFDSRVVACVLHSELLDVHAESVASVKPTTFEGLQFPRKVAATGRWGIAKRPLAMS